MPLYGYARVSSEDQDLSLQIEKLKAAFLLSPSIAALAMSGSSALVAINAHGGIEPGAVGLGVFLPQLDLDLKKLVGWEGGRFQQCRAMG